MAQRSLIARTVLFTALAAVCAFVVVEVHWICAPPERERSKSDEAGADLPTVRYLLPQEPVTAWPARPVRAVRDTLDPAELVLGVTAGGQSRAYPVRLLDDPPGRKVLNDTLGGRLIAATW